LIMPLISKAFGGLDFSNYYVGLAGQAVGLSLIEAKKWARFSPTAASSPWR